MSRRILLRILFGLLLGLGLGALARPARAMSCYDYCTQAGGAAPCSVRCSPGGDLDATHPWARGVNYGAIAYGPRSTADGYAFDKGSSGEANRAALRFCSQRGNDCQVVASFSNGCAAVAAVERNQVYSVGYAHSGIGARDAAMAACSRDHGGGCEIEAWTCTQM